MTDSAAKTMRSRTLIDVLLACTLILLGIFILTNSIIVTAFSVMVIGWAAIISGLISLLESFFKRRGARLITGIVSGALLLALGIMILRNPVAGALSLTIVLGLAFFVRGITSVATGIVSPVGRVVLIAGGLLSVVLGIIVLANLATMTMTLLGILLGVELIVAGATMLATGRRRGRSPSPVG